MVECKRGDQIIPINYQVRDWGLNHSCAESVSEYAFTELSKKELVKLLHKTLKLNEGKLKLLRPKSDPVPGTDF